MFLDRPAMRHPPDTLPDALPHNTHGLGSKLGNLRLQHMHAGIHLRLTQLRAILRRALHDIRIPQREQTRQVAILLGAAPARRAPAAVQQLPEQVRGMRVRVPGHGGLDPRVEPDEDAYQVGFEDVAQRGQVGVGRGRGVAGWGARFLARRGRGRGREGVELAFGTGNGDGDGCERRGRR